MSRRKIREQVFKLLFCSEFNSREEMEQQAEWFYRDDENEVEEEKKQEISEKLNRILDCKKELDEKLSGAVTGWSIDRIGKVELTIMRLAIYEMLYDDTVPVSVAINEAVELAKKYGQEESSGFVNGVLAKLAKKDEDSL